MENELVHSKKEEIFCDSRTIAEKFGKQHKNVLQKIDNLLADLEKLVAENQAVKKSNYPLLFIEKTHAYRGKAFRYVEMNKPAFSLLVMKFSGRKALRWQTRFNAAFYEMEQALLRQSNLEWQREREQGKQIRLSLTDEIKTFVEYAANQGSKNAKTYYVTITKLQYKALGLIEKNEKIDKQFRNTLDAMELNSLLSAERTARKALLDGMEQELHYKDIYQLAKQRVFQLADIMVIDTRKEVGLRDLGVEEK